MNSFAKLLTWLIYDMKNQIIFQVGNWVIRDPLVPGCEDGGYLTVSQEWPISDDCVDVVCVRCDKIMTKKESTLLIAFIKLMTLC